jgi:hypothetical protein
MSEEEVDITVRAIFQAPHKRDTADGSFFSYSLIHTWAQDRYDDDEAFYTSKCNQFASGERL